MTSIGTLNTWAVDFTDFSCVILATMYMYNHVLQILCTNLVTFGFIV